MAAEDSEIEKDRYENHEPDLGCNLSPRRALKMGGIGFEPMTSTV